MEYFVYLSIFTFADDVQGKTIPNQKKPQTRENHPKAKIQSHQSFVQIRHLLQPFDIIHGLHGPQYQEI